MGKLLHGDVTGRILQAAFRVHSTLGPGFLESVYEGAMVRELARGQIPFQRQLDVPIPYLGEVVGKHRLDLVVDGKVIVELKTVKDFNDVHIAVVHSYLNATNLQVALLLNFALRSLQYKRVYRSNPPNPVSPLNPV